MTKTVRTGDVSRIVFTPDAAPFNKVYRFTTPTSLRGQLCRIVALAERRPGDMNVGNETVCAEFEDGERVFVKKAALVEARSREGFRAVAARRRGFEPKPRDYAGAWARRKARAGEASV